MHTTYLAYINDKQNQAKKSAYHRAKQQTQTKLREMKYNWWRAKTDLLQMAADRHDMRAFYADLKAVYGPRAAGSTSVKSTDGTLLTDRSKILKNTYVYSDKLCQHHSFRSGKCIWGRLFLFLWS